MSGAVLGLFSTSGFTDDLTAATAGGQSIELIDLDHLYGGDTNR